VKFKPSHQDTTVCYPFYLRAFKLSQVAASRWIEQRGAHCRMHGVAPEYKMRRHAASADLVGRQTFTQTA
jgi:hypothetical protein